MTGRPLDGVTVLDVTHVLAGPYATFMLALQGAKVIKVEPPVEPDCLRVQGVDPALAATGMDTHFLAAGCNKKYVTINLKSKEGLDLLKRLASQADVFVENYRPGAMAELGISYHDLKAVNPQLIYCSMSAYGQDVHEDRDRAFDGVIQAASGMMHVNAGHRRDPRKCGFAVIDMATAITAAFAIATTLYRRSRTGHGGYIDCSMLDVAMTLMAPEVSAACHIPSMATRPSPAADPAVGIYDTADGQIVLGAFTSRQRVRFWAVMGYPALATLSDLDTMRRSASHMQGEVAGKLLEKPASTWERVFRNAGVPAEKVRTLTQTLDWLELNRPGLLGKFDINRGDGCPSKGKAVLAGFRIDGESPTISSPPAAPGMHNHEVLTELGLSDDDIARLAAKDVVG